MLTLDALARMSDRMPSEPHGLSGSPPYRSPDAHLRTREVRLPTVAQETHRALRSFSFFVIVAMITLVPTGVFVTHALDLYEGRLILGELSRTAGFFALSTALFVVPFAGIGFARELHRFRRARRLLGVDVVIDGSGRVTSSDGTASVQL